MFLLLKHTGSFKNASRNGGLQTSETAQQVKAPATKPESLSSIPGTHILGANPFLQLVL